MTPTQQAAALRELAADTLKIDERINALLRSPDLTYEVDDYLSRASPMILKVADSFDLCADAIDTTPPSLGTVLRQRGVTILREDAL